MATYYWVGGTGTWNASSTTPWASSSGGSGGAGFPTSADDVIFDKNSNVGTGTFQVTATSAVCNNISFGTGVDALDGAMTLDITSLSIFGNCTLPSANLTFSGAGNVTFAATTTGKTITSNGTSVTFISFNGVGGGWTLQDSLTVTSNITLTNGSLNTNNQTVNCNGFSSTAANTRTLTLGTSTINLSGTGSVWNISTTTGLTFSGASSTINLTSTSTTSRTFAGGNGLTFGTINIGGATGISTTTFSSTTTTIGTLSSTKTVAHTILFPSSITINNWTVTGTSGNVVTIGSSSTAQRTITYSGSQINLDYMSFSDINMSYTLGASNPYLVYAGANSTNGGNNSGIAFIDGTTKKAYRLTTGTTWTVPADWNSSNNNIYLICAGGGGATSAVSGNNRAAGGGGGGGGYTALVNQSLTPATSVAYTIGTSAGNTNGGSTTWNSGASTAGGGSKGNATTAPTSSGGAGGTGDFAGGTGGAGAFGTIALTGYGAGAGGGAGGPNGIGGNGGNGFGSLVTANIAGGGGGGNGGGSNGANATSAQGGNGGNNFSGTGGGAGSASGSGTAGTVGGGGGGAANTGSGGSGGAGIDLQNTLGGGGGGGGNATGAGTPVSGLYGGGGAGGRVTTTGTFTAGTAGGQGVIFIVYSTASQNSNFFLMFA